MLLRNGPLDGMEVPPHRAAFVSYPSVVQCDQQHNIASDAMHCYALHIRTDEYVPQDRDLTVAEWFRSFTSLDLPEED